MNNLTGVFQKTENVSAYVLAILSCERTLTFLRML